MSRPVSCNLKQHALEALQLMPQAPRELIETVRAIDSPGMLADLVAAYIDIGPNDKQELLETIDLAARIDKVDEFPGGTPRSVAADARDRQQTKAAFDKRQREAVLREQMATIQRELGEDGGARRRSRGS